MNDLSTITQQTETVSPDNLILNYQAMNQLTSFAALMAEGAYSIPDHLKGKPADCLAIVMQSARWKTDPFSVAQKTFLISGKLGYEAQLVNAIVIANAPIKERLHYEWFGDWKRILGRYKEVPSKNGGTYKIPGWSGDDEKGLGVTVWTTLKGEDEPRSLDLLLTQAQVRNSTLWASDPKQQLAYLAVKRWARLYTPEVILGVYTPDELEEKPAEKVINPAEKKEPEGLEEDYYPEDKFEENLPKWAGLVESGKRRSSDIIATVSAKGKLTPEQINKIEELEK